MKHLVNYRLYGKFPDLNESSKIKYPKVGELSKMVSKEGQKYDSDDVEDFIISLDQSEIDEFKKYWEEHGVIHPSYFKVLTKYFQYFIDVDFLKTVISSTEDAFDAVGTRFEEIIDPSAKDVIRKILSNKDSILRNLNSLKIKMERYLDSV